MGSELQLYGRNQKLQLWAERTRAFRERNVSRRRYMNMDHLLEIDLDNDDDCMIG